MEPTICVLSLNLPMHFLFHIDGDMDLEGIWTPAYYGDEEDFVEEEEEKKKKDVSDNWVLFSTRDGRLLLKKGPHGQSYSINAQYEVEIDNHVVAGRLLSELIRNVRSQVRSGVHQLTTSTIASL